MTRGVTRPGGSPEAFDLRRRGEATPTARQRDDRGVLGALLASVVFGVALIVVVLGDRDGSDRPGTVTVVPSQKTVSLWRQHPITSLRDRTQPAHTMTVVDGAFRVNSTAANTEGSRREVWTMPGTYGDVDVVARIDAPSSLGDASTPRPGIALRTRIAADGSGSALVVDANIWAGIFDDLKVGVWSWPSSLDTVDVAAVDETLSMDHRDARIRAVARTGGADGTATIVIEPSYDEFSAYGFRAGDRIDVRTKTDSFDLTDVPITAVTGSVLTVSAPGGAASPLTVAGGTVSLHDPTGHSMNPRTLYPRYVRVRLIGSHLWLKSWLVDRPEPGWQLDTQIPRADALADEGAIGLVSNHLTGADQYIAFGALQIKPIDRP